MIQIPDDHKLVSFDVRSPFNSIPLQLALDCTENATKKSIVELPLPTDERTRDTEQRIHEAWACLWIPCSFRLEPVVGWIHLQHTRIGVAFFAGIFLLSLGLRWLDWIFLAGYLPSLSINYVGMNKDMEKRLPQLYYIKMKVSYDLGFIAIGVAMAT